MWKDDFQFLNLLLTKLWNTLVQNSLDKLMQLISMEPHIYDLDRGKAQIPEETTQCSTKLIQLNYSYLKILKLKIHSLFLVTLFCVHVTWWLPWGNFVTGIKIFTRNNLIIFIVLIWHLLIVNLLSFLPVLTYSR